MRIAILADIHGNLTALDAVIADIEQVGVDVVLHGGDLADGGANPAAVVDRIRNLGCQGVLGNTDEMLFRPESLRDFAAQRPALRDLFAVVEEMAAATRALLGQERLAWLAGLPRVRKQGPVALVHGTPETPWSAPSAQANDAELRAVFGGLDAAVAVYGHIHVPFVRDMDDLVVANTGSVGLPYDGNRDASYLIVDNGVARVRRVAYDVAAEVRNLRASGLPHADWVCSLIERGSFAMP